MKRIFVLIGLISLFLITSGCTSTRKEEKIYLYGSSGLSIVAKEGAVVIDKTWSPSYYSTYTPKFVVVVHSDTVRWERVPGEIYNKYNVGDTIKPL